ncbi:hypothetical protein BJ742DRAFT_202319 [Cladochytrium replicatum]|nr:hypothetical protein BJ742DRAFT_202319 [Cladochytrium replicatum]
MKCPHIFLAATRTEFTLIPPPLPTAPRIIANSLSTASVATPEHSRSGTNSHASSARTHRSDPPQAPEAAPPPPQPLPEWNSLYATDGLWAIRLLHRSHIKAFLSQTHQAFENSVTASRQSQSQVLDPLSCARWLARVIDVVHPSHTLHSSTLVYPLIAGSIVRRRLAVLKYDLDSNSVAGHHVTLGDDFVPAGPGPRDYSPGIDVKTACDLVLQMRKRVDREFLFHLEFQTPDKVVWRAGFVQAQHMAANNHTRYPGDDRYGFGFASDGTLLWNGKQHKYIDDPQDPHSFLGVRTWGMLIDLGNGSISFVVDGKLQPVAFGYRSEVFSEGDVDYQRNVILTQHLIPMFALNSPPSNLISYGEPPTLKANFGSTPFIHKISANSCESILTMKTSKATQSIVDGTAAEHNEKEEDEKAQIAMERNTFRAAITSETLRSFSHFPPSTYRRSLACTKIQRAWRRYSAAKMRRKLRAKQYAAAILIQRVARKKLHRLRAAKNAAAALIQRNWRRKSFIWKALLRCKYQQPISELHRCAKVIQSKWRHWHLYKNSPIALKYKHRMEDIVAAVNMIIAWWRPLNTRLVEYNALYDQHKAATTIQRVYRGYYLRQLLRPDLRDKLRALGQSVARNRHQLIKVKGVYVLQTAWRQFQVKRVRADKFKIRNRAAARIQAVWKGFWVRSHVHLRFSYGEAIFLSAVCRALRQCHFILKMYKPCGIVCPK